MHQSKGLLKISAGHLNGFLRSAGAREHLHPHLALAQSDDFLEKNLILCLFHRGGIGGEIARAGVEGVKVGCEKDDKADDDHNNDCDPQRLRVFTKGSKHRPVK